MSLLKLTVHDLREPEKGPKHGNFKTGVPEAIHRSDTVIFVRKRETTVLKAPKPVYN